MYSKELVKKLLIEVFSRCSKSATVTLNDIKDIEIPEPDFLNLYEMSISSSITKQKEDLKFKINESYTTFEVVIIPEYRTDIPIFCEALGLEGVVDIFDYIDDTDSAIDLNAGMLDETIWSFSIEKTDDFVNELPPEETTRRFIDDWINNYPGGSEEAQKKIKFWYVKEVILPMFSDETTKGKVNLLVNGFGPFEVEDAVKFLSDVTSPEGGHTLTEMIADIEKVW